MSIGRISSTLLVLCLLGCSGEPTVSISPDAVQQDQSLTAEMKAAMAEPWEPLDLSGNELNVVIDAPADCKVEPGHRTFIRKGPYQLSILTGHDDLAREKELAQSSKLHAFLGFLIEEENLLAYKQAGYDGSPEFIFHYNVTIDDQPYRVVNKIISPRPNSQEHFDWLLKSAKSIRSPKDSSP